LERLILDTTILIAAEPSSGALDEVIGDQDDVAIAAVTAAELLVGEQLAADEHRAARGAFVESVLSTIPIEPYDLDVARAHAELLAHVQRVGRPRGAHDILIAATARVRSRTIVTADTTGFADLPGVAQRLLKS
jgi:tRNA(fMet)-specific endonuclease VapC